MTVKHLAPSTSTSTRISTAQLSLVDQLVQWVEQRIQMQVFRPGMRLPSVRQLATDRGVSRFTVVEAYERLVARGHLQARRGAGFFVRDTAPQPPSRRKAVANPPKPMDMGWLVRNMQFGMAPALSPGNGYLPPELCGGDLLKVGMRALAASPAAQFSQAALAQGYLPLREQLVRKLAELEIACAPANIMTTSGATQCVDLIARKYLRPGDTVLVGDPAWSAQMGALAMTGAKLVGVPYTSQGPDVNALAQLAEQHRPKMLLINSALHNPTGSLLSAATAHQILRIADAHDIMVVEDDIYADLVPSGLSVGRLACLDQLRRVIYLGSFSKVLVPGIRVGYLVARAEVVETLSELKLLTALATPELNERMVYRALTEGSYRKHCLRVQAALEGMREPWLKRMESLGLVPFCRPQAGFLGWFDAKVDTNLLAALALEAGYLFAPGALFSPSLAPNTMLRMNTVTSSDAGMLEWLARTLDKLRQST